ncbi:hypothetical protein GALMADRAFT_148428 [Galerina marginata CBS 339.88]|uniref:laccase n=1 Tax=Galerina marginata (strain CBS 339.88) TaxID=685588 RepID=A0A067S4L2_GALM3|nr:hypothetical protein GALMADRAFT_148428 [Galerina marginata CBS 339.88]
MDCSMLLYLFEYVLQIFFPIAFFAASDIAQVAVPTVGPQSTLYVTNEVIAPDGFPRSASLINGVFPAPLISAQKGDNFKLNVANFLSDSTMLRSTSIHWHGILQRGTNWADGPVGVSQCPISPNRSFLYEFNTTEAGTFWYHSHYGTQYCDGMRGALVVYDPDDPHKTLYDVDDETTVLTLGDWYHYPSPSLEKLPKPDSTLINGKGRFPVDKGRLLDDKLTDLSIVNVEYGRRYRMRIVSIACDSSYTFSIDRHNLTVIEADGESVVPVRGIDTLEIFPGQRYSVVLVANQPVDNYWIRSLPPVEESDPLGTYERGLNSAILRYKGAKYLEPNTTPTQNNFLLETQLHALTDPRAPGKPIMDGGDVNLHFNLSYDKEKELFAINGTSFKPPKVPVLLQILTGTPPEQLLPKGSIYKLPRNKSISISVLPGVFDGPHPFHLHGHSFSVVRSANSSTYNYYNPVRRDTVSLGYPSPEAQANPILDPDPYPEKGSNVTIRFRTDNPGPWIFHCHIDWHLEIGMAIVFVEDRKDIPDVVRPPEQWQYLCPIFDNLPANMTSISTVSIGPTSSTVSIGPTSSTVSVVPTH